MTIRNARFKRGSIVVFCFIALTIVGCGSVIDFKKIGSQITPTHQVTKTKVVKVTKKKIVPRKINSDCSYIIRDLSIPNAKDVWCIPRALQ
jgi:hypothetical protein